jgi:glutathione S-transferase
MKTKGVSPFLAGELSLADLYLAPPVFYVSLTPDAEELFAGAEGFAAWWERVQALPSYQATVPSFG